MTQSFHRLVDLGFDSFFSRAFERHLDTSLLPARVIVEHRGGYLVAAERGDLPAQLTGKSRHAATSRDALPAVGDWVVLRPPERDGVAALEAVLPRRTAFVRGLAGGTTDAQVVAANVDVVQLAEGCRFRDCRHRGEPGCAVLAALEDGTLDASRWTSMVKLERELQSLAVRQDARARAEQKRTRKVIARAVRSRPDKRR